MDKQIHFGTDGIRGHADLFPFTNTGLLRLGTAISFWAKTKYHENPSVLIASDTRISSPQIKEALSNSLASNNITVCDAEILPTPAVLQLMISEKKFDFGIMISASHNPYQDNGIKLFDGKTGKLTQKDEQTIEKYFSSISLPKIKSSSITNWSNAGDAYKKNIISLFRPNFLMGKKIILDCANGATYKVAPEIFSSLGAEVISIACTPDGKNINEACGTLHPQALQEKVQKSQAYAGFAFDGDGDRLIAVNKNGEIKDGDDLLAILLLHPKIKISNTVVGTVMTNHGFEKYLNEGNKNLIRTKVGDKYVSAELERKNIIIGGETSGHIIMRDYLPTGDGIFAALRTLESIIENNNEEIKTFKKLPQVLVNMPVSKKKSLQEEPYAKLIALHEKQVSGRMVVRYSGTENVLRIMTEDKTQKQATLVANSLAEALQSALK